MLLCCVFGVSAKLITLRININAFFFGPVTVKMMIIPKNQNNMETVLLLLYKILILNSNKIVIY